MSTTNGAVEDGPTAQSTPGPNHPALRDGPATTRRLVLSVAEAAEALGVSDDLVYELTERGELPRLHFGRRKLIPTQAIDLVISHALRDFDPGVLLSSLAGRGPGNGSAPGRDDIDP